MLAKFCRRKAAVMALALLIILASALASGYIRAQKKAEQVLAVFNVGENRDGISIAADLADREACAQNIVTLAVRYFGETGNPSIQRVRDIILRMQSEESKPALYADDEALTQEVNVLAGDLERADLTAENRSSLAEQISIFNNKANTIRYDSYNVYVQDYQKSLADPVTAFYAGLARKVEYFR